MIMKNDNIYYDIEFTPVLGCYYLNLFLKYAESQAVSLYTIFLIFPLFYDEEFLKYVLKRKQTRSFGQIIDDYITLNKSNEFWIKYLMRYETSHRLCFESIYLGILTHSLKLDDNGITLVRNIAQHVNLCDSSKKKAIEIIGKMIYKMSYQDLLRIMKVGKVND